MKTVYLDGTFKISPPGFSQVYLISAERNGYVFPILYILTEDKMQETYERLLNEICELWPLFSPLYISVDFELAMINAIKNVFPLAEINGCYFHLMQNMRKTLRKKNLMNQYSNDSDFAIKCSKIIY